MLNPPPEEVAWKEDGSVGRETPHRKAARQRTWPAWTWTATGHGNRVHLGRSQVGVITSLTPSPDPAQEHRAVPDGGRVPQIGDRGRGRETGLAPRAHPGWDSRSATREKTRPRR